MIGTILTYAGDSPSALGSPDVAKVVELFKQQNEILKAALTTCVIVPEGTRLKSLNVEKENDDQT